MSGYVPPSSSDIPFVFTESGYVPPPSDDVTFSFAALTQSNLNAFIKCLSVGEENLEASIKPTGISSYSDVLSYIKAFKRKYADIGAAIRRIDKEEPVDLSGYIKSFTVRDLEFFIGGHLPADIRSTIKGWSLGNIKNLSTGIIGEWFKGSLDLNIFIDTHPPANLKSFIHAWHILDLPAEISSVYKFDLEAVIQSTTLANLLAQVLAIDPLNLQGLLHGWDERFLPAEIDGVYGPYDIQAYLRVYPYKNLLSYVRGVYSSILNLKAVVEGYYISNLAAFIATIDAVNLSAELVATGQAEGLQAFIVPNVIRIKKAVWVSLLEHKNLSALINFQCLHSASVNLPVEFGTVYKKLDLTGMIWGWWTADELYELQCYINTSIYDVENKIDLVFVPYNPYTQLKIMFDVIGHTTSTLSAAIIADPRVLLSRTLSAYIRPLVQSNYTELPPNVRPRSNVIVYKFTDKMEEEWRKFVEIMFRKDGAEPYHYFYVSGTEKVYKIDRSRHWTIWATSYNRDDETMFDRNNIRTKFIFRMDRYESVDEAVRDLIDRVSAYRESLLAAYINAVDDRPQLNLPTSIFGFGGKKRRWAKYLNAVIGAFAHGFKQLGASLICGGVAAVGGLVTDVYIDDVWYRVHAFTSNEDFIVSNVGDVDYLIVGGGGAGGRHNVGAGGGAGGLLEGSYSVEVGSYEVVVGDGGVGGDAVGPNGESSSVFGKSADGGGGGGGGEWNHCSLKPGQDGGSGGGGGGGYECGNAYGGDGTVGQGNDGGRGFDGATSARAGGGGGGADVVGTNASSGKGGNGGSGKASDITGSVVYYAGGGGGGTNSSTAGNRGIGGQGGGGDGAYGSSSSTAQSGDANTGGGGGGKAENSSGDPGSGGSGIVIIRYKIL